VLRKGKRRRGRENREGKGDEKNRHSSSSRGDLLVQDRCGRKKEKKKKKKERGEGRGQGTPRGRAFESSLSLRKKKKGGEEKEGRGKDDRRWDALINLFSFNN